MRELFEERYRRWRARIASGDIVLSSFEKDYISNPEFDAIVELGEAAIPYILEKIECDEDAHFLRHAVDRIRSRQ